MSQITVQGKQRALIRVAESRVAALDAVSASRVHASRCMEALPISPATLKRVGIAAGAAASVMGVLAGLRRKKKAAEKKVAKPSESFYMLLVQLVAPVLLPLLQRSLQKMTADSSSDSHGKAVSF